MVVEDLIKLLQEKVPSGSEIGIVQYYDSIYMDIDVKYEKASKQTRKQGARYITSKAKSGVFFLTMKKFY